MTGMLRDGPLGMGGIWHFDECDPSVIANDSSGHWNTGYLLPPGYRPLWIDETEGAKVNCSLNFSSVLSHVYVYDSWSLDIEQNITVEAWFRPMFTEYVDTIDFDDDFGSVSYTHLRAHET